MKRANPSQLDNRVFVPTAPGRHPARVARPETGQTSGEARVLPVQGNVYLLAGAGGKHRSAVGDDGVLLVDTSAGNITDKLLDAIRKLSAKPIRFILNTNADADHMGGNERLAAVGSSGPAAAQFPAISQPSLD